jgi:hypothetical protein
MSNKARPSLKKHGHLCMGPHAKLRATKRQALKLATTPAEMRLVDRLYDKAVQRLGAAAPRGGGR